MRKLCPLRKQTRKLNNNPKDNLSTVEEFLECKLTDCAWYDDEGLGKCAIIDISGIAEIMFDNRMDMVRKDTCVEE